MRWMLRLFLLAPLAACAIPHPPPPPDDQAMSDPLLIMTTARLNQHLRDMKRASPKPGTSAPNGDAGAAVAAAATGLSVVSPAAGLSGLGGGLLSGINILASRQITEAEVPWLLIWAPEEEGPIPNVGAHYANVMVEALAESARKREPGAQVDVTTIPINGTPLDTKSKAMVRAQVPGEKWSDVVFVPAQRDDPLTPRLPVRLVGYDGKQSLAIIRPTVYNADMDGLHMIRTSHWPTLEAFADASKKLPTYAWIYLPPRTAPFFANGKWIYSLEPLMLNRGYIRRFIEPAKVTAQAGATTP